LLRPTRWLGRDAPLGRVAAATAARQPHQLARPAANTASAQSERFCPRVLMESGTSRLDPPGSSKGARKFQATFPETRRQSSIGATLDRKRRCLSSIRSREQTCAEDAANRNKAVAADESFRQSARQIHESRLDQRNQA